MGESPGKNTVHEKSSQSLGINGNPMPLNGTAIGVVPGVLVIEWPPVVTDPSGSQWEESHHRPTPQLLLQRLLPNLPHQYGLQYTHPHRIKTHTHTHTLVVYSIRIRINGWVKLPCKCRRQGHSRGVDRRWPVRFERGKGVLVSRPRPSRRGCWWRSAVEGDAVGMVWGWKGKSDRGSLRGCPWRWSSALLSGFLNPTQLEN